jgi:hypothetical protein
MLVGEECLRDEDAEFLKRRGWDCEAKEVPVDGGRKEVHIIVHGFPFPEKYKPRAADLLVRQLPGYPETGMDMFWTRPDIVLSTNGQRPQSTEVTENHGGLAWQRWSRHMNAWRSQVDNLETFFAAIGREINK